MKLKVTSILITALLVMLAAADLHASYYNQGRSYFVKKQYDKAKEMFLKAGETGNGNAYYQIGELEKERRDYDEAMKYFKLAISKKAINQYYLRNSYWNILLIAEEKGDYDEVIRTSKKMYIRLKDQSARTKIERLINKFLWTENKEAIEKYNLGISRKNRGDNPGAVDAFNQALSIDYSFIAPKFEIGMIAYRDGNYDRALSYLNDVVSSIPFYAEAHLIVGEIYYEKNYCTSAIDHFNKAFEFGFIGSKTAYLIRLKRGACYLKTGSYDRAAEDIEKALKYNPDSRKTMLLLSAIKIKKAEYDGALEILKKALQKNPKDTAVLYQIGSTYYKKNDRRYLEYFDALINIIKDNEKLVSEYGKVFEIAAKVHYEKKNYARAITLITTLPENRRSYELTGNLARSYFHTEKYASAIEHFRKISLSSDDKYLLCLSHARSGNREKAREFLSSLMIYDEYSARAEKDPALAPILEELRDKTPID